MNDRQTPPEVVLRRLSDFIRGRNDALVGEWSAHVATLSPAQELSRSVLVDHLPQILERIAALIEATDSGAHVAGSRLQRRMPSIDWRGASTSRP